MLETFELLQNEPDPNKQFRNIRDYLKRFKDELDIIVTSIGYENLNEDLRKRFDNIMTDTVGEIVAQTVKAKYASFEELEATTAKVKKLFADYAKITELDAVKIKVENLEAETANIKDLFADYATIKQLNATNAKIQNLESADITFTNSIKSINGSISTINGNITTINGSISTISGNISTIDGNITTINGDISTINGKVSAAEGEIKSLKTDKLNAKDVTASYINGKFSSAAWLSVDTGKFKSIAFDYAGQTRLFTPVGTVSIGGKGYYVLGTPTS